MNTSTWGVGRTKGTMKAEGGRRGPRSSGTKHQGIHPPPSSRGLHSRPPSEPRPAEGGTDQECQKLLRVGRVPGVAGGPLARGRPDFQGASSLRRPRRRGELGLRTPRRPPARPEPCATGPGEARKQGGCGGSGWTRGSSGESGGRGPKAKLTMVRTELSGEEEDEEKEEEKPSQAAPRRQRKGGRK